jgi:hypothetical protein
VVEEKDDGAVEVVKEAEGVAVRGDNNYRQPIGLLAIIDTLLFTNNYCISTFFCLWNAFLCGMCLSLYPMYLCGTRLFVERTLLWNALFVERTPFLFVECLFLWNVFICGTQLQSNHYHAGVGDHR